MCHSCNANIDLHNLTLDLEKLRNLGHLESSPSSAYKKMPFKGNRRRRPRRPAYIILTWLHYRENWIHFNKNVFEHLLCAQHSTIYYHPMNTTDHNAELKAMLAILIKHNIVSTHVRKINSSNLNGKVMKER